MRGSCFLLLLSYAKLIPGVKQDSFLLKKKATAWKNRGQEDEKVFVSIFKYEETDCFY